MYSKLVPVLESNKSQPLLTFESKLKKELKKVPSQLEGDVSRENGPQGTVFIIHHPNGKPHMICWKCTKKTGKMMPKQQIRKILLIYAHRMNYYSGQIFFFLKRILKYKDTDSSVSQEHFLKWFSDALFYSPKNTVFKIPIIGTFSLQVSDHSPYHAEYHPAQLAILAPLIKTGGYKYEENSMALVGYWLKNFCTEFWNIYIKSDEHYSILLYQAIFQKK
jgi:hypothetical protein